MSPTRRASPSGRTTRFESAIERAKALAGDKVAGVGGGTPFFEQLGSAPVELEGPLSVEDGKDVTHLR